MLSKHNLTVVEFVETPIGEFYAKTGLLGATKGSVGLNSAMYSSIVDFLEVTAALSDPATDEVDYTAINVGPSRRTDN